MAAEKDDISAAVEKNLTIQILIEERDALLRDWDAEQRKVRRLESDIEDLQRANDRLRVELRRERGLA